MECLRGTNYFTTSGLVQTAQIEKLLFQAAFFIKKG